MLVNVAAISILQVSGGKIYIRGLVKLEERTSQPCDAKFAVFIGGDGLLGCICLKCGQTQTVDSPVPYLELSVTLIVPSGTSYFTAFLRVLSPPPVLRPVLRFSKTLA